MSVVNAWLGAATPTSARVVTEVTTATDTFVHVSTDPSLVASVVYGPVTPTSENIASVNLTGLDPNTRYYFAVEHESVLETEFAGQFLTHPTPGVPASFTFAASGCAGLTPDFPGEGSVLASTRLSNHPVFDTIRERAVDENWLFFFHMGDLHYYDLGSGNHGIIGGGSLDNYRAAFSNVLLQPRQHALFRNVCCPYVWDDHCYGPNNSDGTLATKANAQQVFRERVPHYTLEEPSGPIYHSFEVGRVLFIVSDTRSERTPSAESDGPDKTMLGVTQKAWIEDTLTNTTAEFFIWILPSQWMGTTDDSYNGYMTERQEMIGIFNSTNFRERMCIVSADYHGLAIDTGQNSPGSIPVFQFASLDSTPGSGSGGNYDQGSQDGRNQYGSISITDTGTAITVEGSGWIGENLWLSHDFTIQTEEEEPPPPPPPPGPTVVEEFVGEPHYEYIFGQARSGLISAEIPLYGVSMNTILNAPHDFTGTFQADMTGVSNQDLANATEPGRTFVVVERAGFPVWDGNLVARVYQAQSKSYQTFARSVSAYPYRVKMDASYFPSGFVIEEVEQTEAYLLLWETLQSKPESDLRVTIPQPIDTGVLKTMNVQPYEDKYFGDVMDEIANGADGFDVRIVTRKIDGQYVRIMQIGYPTIGQADSNRLVFEYPGPMMNYWRTDGVTSAGTHIHGLGSGQGEDMLRHDVVHQNLIDGGYMRWDLDIQLKEVTNQSVLNSLTSRTAIIDRPPKKIYSVEVHGREEPEFGTYLPGDACTLKFEDAAHPGGVRFPTRIIGWRLTPSSKDSVEKVAVFFEGGEEGGGS